jgi:hypothetical protein
MLQKKEEVTMKQISKGSIRICVNWFDNTVQEAKVSGERNKRRSIERRSEKELRA